MITGILKKTKLIILLFGVMLLSSVAFAKSAEACEVPDNSLLGIPTWYKYLDGVEVAQNDGSVVCQPTIKLKTGDNKLPKQDILLIVAAVLEILIRIAGIAAFIYLLYGGFMYLTSSGNSESVKNAGSTLLNAAIGLAIAISATTIINFFANRLSS
jgi:hypothetical protein